MSIWYPSISARRLPALIRVTVVCALFAGVYGALHDQVSYTISPEYFTQLKFHQFAYADFGWSPRVLAAEVGFLATWWVGLIGGWFIARAGLAELTERSTRYYTARTLAMAGGVAVTIGALGALLGAVQAHDDLSGWRAWQENLDLRDLPGFIIVAYLHWASYLGGLLGVVAAAVYVKRTLARAEQGAADRPHEHAVAAMRPSPREPAAER
jgi:hypothetical protein